MGMSFLQGLGGVGAGIMGAQQILQRQKEAEQRSKSLELQQTEQQMRIDAANVALKEKEDDKLFGKLQNDRARMSGVAPESGMAGVTPGGDQDKGLSAQMAGMGLTNTDKTTFGMDAKGERYGDVQKHQAYAQRAAEKGDIDGEMKYSKYAKLLENEGVDQLWGDLESGMSPEAAKARYDQNGSLKLGSGAFDYDPKTRSITLEMNGSPVTVTRENYERMKLGYADRTKLDYEKTKLDNEALKPAAQLKLQEMKDIAAAIRDDKRFEVMLRAAELRSRRGDTDGKPPAQVATAEWLVKNGVAKDMAEAWAQVKQLNEPVKEQVNFDSFGGTQTHDPKTGEIANFDSSGKKIVIRPATKGVTKTPAEPPSQYEAPQAALEYLKKNPSTANQFKQKYGYLPNDVAHPTPTAQPQPQTQPRPSIITATTEAARLKGLRDRATEADTRARQLAATREEKRLLGIE